MTIEQLKETLYEKMAKAVEANNFEQAERCGNVLHQLLCGESNSKVADAHAGMPPNPFSGARDDFDN